MHPSLKALLFSCAAEPDAALPGLVMKQAACFSLHTREFDFITYI